MLEPLPWHRLWRQYAYVLRVSWLFPLYVWQGLPLYGRPLLLLSGVAALAPHTARRRAALTGAVCGAVWSVFSDRPFGLHAAVLALAGYVGACFPHRLCGTLLAAAMGAILLCPASLGMTVAFTPPLFVLARATLKERSASRCLFTVAAP